MIEIIYDAVNGQVIRFGFGSVSPQNLNHEYREETTGIIGPHYRIHGM